MAFKKKNLRNGRINTRVSIKEHQEILTKAQVYCDGDISKFMRMAALEYRPLKRVTR